MSKQAKHAVREAFKLQKFLKTPTPNIQLEAFILRGDFKSNKNVLFFQHTEDRRQKQENTKKGHFYGKK